ncbi:MAG TPA: glycosyltransferase family 39 protein [Gammaproteobacteria bacterium]|nr:glycosyltransferase family 39 protein [Gammaproteobacteria bacterium]
MLNSENASRVVGWALLITLMIKLALCQIIPVTGDEAYYAIWGIFPSWGGYDHTPFIGWLLYPFLKISHQQVILRLPIVLTTTLIGWLIYAFLRREDRVKAAWASLLFLISPLSLCAVLVTTDTPVILFSFLSGLCVLKALEKKDHLGWFALGGLCLGLAFFSKYFAVLLALGYFVYLVIAAPTKKRILGLFIMFLCVLPFGLENIWWNYNHAWANILFNVYNRNTQDHFRITTVLTYIVTLFYIMTPPLFYYLIKYRQKLFQKTALNYFILVPILFFLILSTWKTIGLHWPLSFITFVYIWAGIYLSQAELKKAFKFLVWFTGAHLVLALTIAVLPMDTIYKLPLKEKLYTKIVFFFKHKQLRDSLNQYNNNYTFTSIDYVQADMMFYDSDQYCPTFGTGDVHGREDDLITNWATYNHKNLLIFYSRPPRSAEYKPYFAKTKVKSFIYDHATFYYVLGQDFNYPAYRDTVLKQINDEYWQIPDYLPHAPSFFYQKYFAKQE